MDRNHDTLVMTPQQQQNQNHQPVECIEAAATTAPKEGVDQQGELQVEGGTTSDEHLVGGSSSAERNGSAAIASPLLAPSTIDLLPPTTTTTTEGKAITSSSVVNTPRSAVATSECNSSSKVTGGLSVSAASVVSADGGSSSATVNDSTRNRRRAVIGVRYKTKFCHTFMESGECRYGDSCVFAHGEEEQSKYLAIAEAAERDNSNSASTTNNNSHHRHHPNSQPAKFTIPLPASVDRFLHSDTTWWKSFYNIEGGGNPLAAHHNASYGNGGGADDDEQHRGSRDYGFGVSAEEERRRALEGNRRVPHAELERHRLQRKAEAIARVNKLHEDEDYHHHNNASSSSGGFNGAIDSATMSDLLNAHNEEEGHSAASLPGMGYGPYIGNGMYYFTNCHDEAESSSLSQHDGGLTADFSSMDMGTTTTTGSGIGAVRGSSSTLADSSSTTMVDMIGRSSGGSSPSKYKKVYTHNPYCTV